MSFYVTQPLPHQKVIFKEHTVPLFWEQGLGKTKTAIDNFRYHKSKDRNFKMLYFCPAYLVSTIKQEIHKHSRFTDEQVVIIRGNIEENCERFDASAEVYVISYSTAIPIKRGKEHDKRMVTAICKMMTEDVQRRWFVVADESSCLSDVTNKASKLMKCVGNYADIRWVLNGTPYRRFLDDFFGQFMFLNGSFMGHTSVTSFRAEFMKLAQNGQGYNFPVGDKPEGVRKVQQFLASHASILRKKDILKDLPDKIYSSIKIPRPEKIAYLYRELEETGMTCFDDGDPILALHILSKNIRLRQIMAGIDPNTQQVVRVPEDKYAMLSEYYKDKLKYQRGIIWCSFRAEFEELRKVLPKETGCICGQMKKEVIDKIISDYCTGKINCILATQQTIYKGVTLLPTDYELYFSNVYSLEVRLQSEDRSHRHGQTNGLQIIDFYYENCIEEKVIGVLLDKKVREQAVMTGGQVNKCMKCGRMVDYGRKYLCEACSKQATY